MEVHNQYYINNRRMKILIFSSIFQVMLLNVLALTNYVQNGGFENPLVTVQYLQKTSIPFWTGSFDIVQVRGTDGPTTTQFVDLSTSVNGFIQQTVSLPFDGTYSLSFIGKDRGADPTVFNESAADIYWNGIKVLESRPRPMEIVKYSVNIQGKVGQNYLKFVEVGSYNSLGLLIDDVSIYLVKKNSSLLLQKINKFVSSAKNLITTMPLNQLKLAYLCFFIEDISLYPYANRNYTEKVNDIFNFINVVETLKWNFYVIAFNKNVKNLTIPVSNYTLYSSPKHLQMDDKDDSLIQNIYPFLIFSTSQTIAVLALLKLIFYSIKNYSVSRFLRRFYFFPCAFLQIVFEGSISYFTYLSFNQFKILFSFTAADKMFLGFAVIFFWICLIHVLCFYFGINYFYNKKSGYFMYCYYRSMPGLSFVTLRIGVRSIIRGIIFSTLESDYLTQCLLLIVVEVAFIAVSIQLQIKYEIFIYQSKFCLQILHHSFLIGMTAFLLIEHQMENEADDSLNLLFESVILMCIYGIGALASLDFTIQLFSHKRVYSQQFTALTRIQKRVIIKKVNSVFVNIKRN